MKTILVIGGTGMLGQTVARQLKNDDYTVRIFSRDRAKALELFDDSYEIFEGELNDPETLPTALDGCDGVYINLSGEIVGPGTANIVTTAKNTTIEQIGFISGATVRKENSWHPMIKNMYLGEEALKSGGIPYTIFKPGWFMESLPRFVVKGKVMLLGKQKNLWPWACSEDLARMVSNSFQVEGARNKSLWVKGPDIMTLPEALKRYCAVFHPEIDRIKPMPWFIAKIMALFLPKGFKFMIGMFKYFDTHEDEGDATEANELLGAPVTTLDQWMDQQKKDQD